MDGQYQIEIQKLREDVNLLRRDLNAAETGKLAEISKWAGLLGLVISTVLASTAIWDWAVTEKAKQVEVNVARVDTILTELAKANTIVAQLPLQSPQSQSIAQSLNALKIPLLDTAVKTLREFQDSEYSEVSSGALLSIAYELSNQHRYNEAIEIAQLAGQNAKSKAIEIEARRVAATASFNSLDSERISSARDEYKSAILDSTNVPGLARYYILSNVLRDWAVAEALIGNCEESRAIVLEFENRFDHSGAKIIAIQGKSATLELLRTLYLCS